MATVGNKTESERARPPSPPPARSRTTSVQLELLPRARSESAPFESRSRTNSENPGRSGGEGELHHRLLGPSLQKSGQDGVDQVAVSDIIYQASAGSKYFEHQKQKEKELTKKVEAILKQAEKVSKQDLAAAKVLVDALVNKLESTRILDQTIVHIDCDAFYASVEELDFPELKEKPFAVGNGVLCTCNYEARKFGVRSAMAEFVARKICPQLIVLPLNFPKYIAKSNAIKAILSEYDPNICAMTLDEAYLNITEYCQRVGKDRELVVQEIRDRVYRETQLTVSAGIGPNSRVAKIASNMNKPNGQFVIANDRESVMEFMRTLEVRKVTGVGYVLERQLNAVGVIKCGDIYEKAPLLHELFSDINLSFLLDCYLGLGSTVIKPIEQYERKSISCETTFRDLSSPSEIKQKLWQVATDLEKDCKRLNIAGRKLGLKMKKHTYEALSRQRPVAKPINSAEDLYKYGVQMLEKEMPITIRLIGLRLTELVDLSVEGPMKTFLKGSRRSTQVLADTSGGSGGAEETDAAAEDIEEDLGFMIHSQGDSGPNYRSWSKAHTAANLPSAPTESSAGSSSRKRSSSSQPDFSSEAPTDPTSPLTPPPPVPDPTPTDDRIKDEGGPAAEQVACPVCGNLVSGEPSALNQHVDWCLSRGAILEAVQETYTKRLKTG
ncbi:DNA polymerase kappa [Myxozyma melibiosi]|uniref:DNA polymerase kappa n=1 Tax=Myxozyma melibiosi TaxID=54550 RepID=A0ABR1FEG1_9ASCO